MKVTDEMVNRFLMWKFPEDFHPDGGILFKRESDYEHPEFGRTKFAPTGTNLLDAQQARAMLEHVLHVEPVDYLTCTEREVKYMDIYSRPGTKVVFHGRGGYPSQIEDAKKILTLGGVYTVSDMDVGHSRSSVSLVEIHGYFNTVLFGPYQG